VFEAEQASLKWWGGRRAVEKLRVAAFLMLRSRFSAVPPKERQYSDPGAMKSWCTAHERGPEGPSGEVGPWLDQRWWRRGLKG